MEKGVGGAFATTWQISKDKILPYLLDWSALPVSKICCEGDEYSTDDWRQVFDFMIALGIDSPIANPNSFKFSVPSWESLHVRQPVWRRAIRKISVWIKGTYPDVPKRTREETEEWKRRLVGVRIDKVDLGKVIERDRTKQ